MNRTRKPCHLLGTGISTAERLLAYLGGFCILAMTLMVTYNVILRYVFRSPTSWSLEITGYLMVACIFFPLALAQAEDRQIKVDLVYSRLSQRLKSIVDLMVSTIALSFFVLLTIKSLNMAIFSYQHQLVSSPVVKIPLFSSQMVITVGACMLCVRLILQIHRRIALFSSKYPERHDT